jgi:hypothetical protein
MLMFYQCEGDVMSDMPVACGFNERVVVTRGPAIGDARGSNGGLWW